MLATNCYKLPNMAHIRLICLNWGEVPHRVCRICAPSLSFWKKAALYLFLKCIAMQICIKSHFMCDVSTDDIKYVAIVVSSLHNKSISSILWVQNWGVVCSGHAAQHHLTTIWLPVEAILYLLSCCCRVSLCHSCFRAMRAVMWTAKNESISQHAVTVIFSCGPSFFAHCAAAPASSRTAGRICRRLHSLFICYSCHWIYIFNFC